MGSSISSTLSSLMALCSDDADMGWDEESGEEEGGENWPDEGKKENATRARFNEEMGCKNSRVQNVQKRALLYIYLSNVQKESSSSNPGCVRNLRLTVRYSKGMSAPRLVRGRKLAQIYPGTLPDRTRWPAAPLTAAGGRDGRDGCGCRRGRLKAPGSTCESELMRVFVQKSDNAGSHAVLVASLAGRAADRLSPICISFRRRRARSIPG